MTTMDTSAVRQGDPALLEHDIARELLHSTIPARVAFLWSDGTPRVIPTWFHWNGTEIVLATYVAGPDIRHQATRLAALRANPAVAITIDTEGFPPRSLTIRGTVTVEEVDGLAAEYRAAARRYLGAEAGEAMLAAVDQPGTRQARMVVRPEWVGVLDFDTRLPSAQGGVLG